MGSRGIEREREENGIGGSWVDWKMGGKKKGRKAEGRKEERVGVGWVGRWVDGWVDG